VIFFKQKRSVVSSKSDFLFKPDFLIYCVRGDNPTLESFNLKKIILI